MDFTRRQYCWCLYEPTFDTFEGFWDHVATVDSQAEFSRSLTQGTSLTNGESLTESTSESISISVGAKYSFIPKVFEGSITVTGTLSQTTSQMMSQSITSSVSETCAVTYPSASSLGFNFLQVYQWSMEGIDNNQNTLSTTKSCNTFGIYTMTQASRRPICPLGDCKDEFCQECISGTDYSKTQRVLNAKSLTQKSPSALRGGRNTQQYYDESDHIKASNIHVQNNITAFEGIDVIVFRMQACSK